MPPRNGISSTSAVRSPRRAAVTAAAVRAEPPPTTTTSKSPATGTRSSGTRTLPAATVSAPGLGGAQPRGDRGHRLQQHVPARQLGTGRGAQGVTILQQGASEVLLLARDDRLVLAEAGVHLLGQLLEPFLTFLSQLGAQHLAPQRGEHERGYRLAAQPAREVVQAVGEGRGRVEPPARLECAEAGEAVPQAFEAEVIDHCLDRVGEFGGGEICHGRCLMARAGAGWQRWAGHDSPPRGGRGWHEGARSSRGHRAASARRWPAGWPVTACTSGSSPAARSGWTGSPRSCAPRIASRCTLFPPT